VKDTIGLAELATLVTVAGVSIYVAGLLGLTLAIRLRLTDDIATAWYAVALLPRTDVAGQGVKIWLTWPLPIVVLLVVLETVAAYFGVSDTVVCLPQLYAMLTSISDCTEPSHLIDRVVVLPGLVVLALFSVLALRYINKESTKEEQPRWTRWTTESKFIVATPLIAATGSLLMSQGSILIVRAAREASTPVLQVLTYGVFPGPIVLLIGSFFVGVAGAAMLDRPLPHVQIDCDPTLPRDYLAEEENLFTKENLYLVTHTEGHWHLLDDDQNELLSVPDRLVSAVHTIPKKRPGPYWLGPPRR
jgi:hypothetical protein